MIEQGLLQLLSGNSGVTALIPNDVGGHPQIHWLVAPKGEKPPYIVLSRVVTGDTYTMAGATGLRDGLFQVDCYTDTKAGISAGYYLGRRISTAVRQVLESYRGNLPDTDATAVTAVFTEKDWDMPYEEGGGGFVFRALLEFRVWYYESAITVPSGPDPLITIAGGTF